MTKRRWPSLAATTDLPGVGTDVPSRAKTEEAHICRDFRF